MYDTIKNYLTSQPVEAEQLFDLNLTCLHLDQLGRAEQLSDAWFDFAQDVIEALRGLCQAGINIGKDAKYLIQDLEQVLDEHSADWRLLGMPEGVVMARQLLFG